MTGESVLSADPEASSSRRADDEPARTKRIA